MASVWVDVNGIISSSCDFSGTMTNYTTNNGVAGPTNIVLRNSYTISESETWTEVYNYNGLTISFRTYVSGSSRYIAHKWTLNGHTYSNATSTGTGSTFDGKYSIGFHYDASLQKAKVQFFYYVGNLWRVNGTIKDGTYVGSTDLYNWIVNNPYVSAKSGGAGSGYIGNSLVSNKKMIGYNVPTSDAINTKTESVQVYSAAPLANMPKMGDGFARIKLIRESLEVNFWDIVLKSDLSAAVNCGSAPSTAQWNSDDILFYGESQKTKPTVTDGVFYHVGSTDYTRSCVSFPLKQEYIILGGSSKVNFIAKAQDAYHNQWIQAGVLLEQVYGKFLTEYAYKVSEYPEAVAVDAFGLYESAKNLNSPQTARRITVRFDYGTWEMFDIKVNILG